MIWSSLFLTVLLTTGFSARELELVTVTDASFTLTWTTDQAGVGTVVYGTDGKALANQVSERRATRFHDLTVTGLAPQTAYYFRVAQDGALSPPKFMGPRTVTTLDPPPGRFLFSFAVMNDVHAMEDIDGLMVLPVSFIPPLTPGYTWRFPVDNYWEFTLRAAVDAVNFSGAELCIVNGDLTSWFSEEEFGAVKKYLDRLRLPYYVTRGNHDRVGDYPEDYFKKTFGLDSTWYSFEHRGFHFTIMDDTRLKDGFTEVPEAEWQWLAKDLADHRGRPTFIFSHRPLGPGWVDVDKSTQSRFLKTVSENPQVVAVMNAHTHMAKVTRIPDTPGGTLFITVPATKNYPSGWGLVKVYETGLMYNFIRLDCPDCLEWNHITRGENHGLSHRKAFGKLGDRNLVYPFSPEVRKLIAGPAD